MSSAALPLRLFPQVPQSVPTDQIATAADYYNNTLSNSKLISAAAAAELTQKIYTLPTTISAGTRFVTAVSKNISFQNFNILISAPSGVISLSISSGGLFYGGNPNIVISGYNSSWAAYPTVDSFIAATTWFIEFENVAPLSSYIPVVITTTFVADLPAGTIMIFKSPNMQVTGTNYLGYTRGAYAAIIPLGSALSVSATRNITKSEFTLTSSINGQLLIAAAGSSGIRMEWCRDVSILSLAAGAVAQATVNFPTTFTTSCYGIYGLTVREDTAGVTIASKPFGAPSTTSQIIEVKNTSGIAAGQLYINLWAMGI